MKDTWLYSLRGCRSRGTYSSPSLRDSVSIQNPSVPKSHTQQQTEHLLVSYHVLDIEIHVFHTLIQSYSITLILEIQNLEKRGVKWD